VFAVRAPLTLCVVLTERGRNTTREDGSKKTLPELVEMLKVCVVCVSSRNTDA
jgi:hypothetical protein